MIGFIINARFYRLRKIKQAHQAEQPPCCSALVPISPRIYESGNLLFRYILRSKWSEECANIISHNFGFLHGSKMSAARH